MTKPTDEVRLYLVGIHFHSDNQIPQFYNLRFT